MGGIILARGYYDRPDLTSEKFIANPFTNEGEVISEEEAAKIFEAFRRGKNSQNISGSGLGLRITKRIMDFHHAEISYSSNNKNNIFHLSFSI